MKVDRRVQPLALQLINKTHLPRIEEQPKSRRPLREEAPPHEVWGTLHP
jgi:hypothetical protein